MAIVGVFSTFNICAFGPYRKMMIRKYQTLVPLFFFAFLLIAAEQEEQVLFNGKDISGWKLVNPAASDCWKVVSAVSLDPSDPKKLTSTGDGGTDQGIL